MSQPGTYTGSLSAEWHLARAFAGSGAARLPVAAGDYSSVIKNLSIYSGRDLTPSAGWTSGAYGGTNSPDDPHRADLDGSDDWFASGAFALSGSGFVAEAWLKVAAAPSTDRMILSHGATNTDGWYVRHGSNGYLALYLHRSGDHDVISGPVMPTGAWTHVAVRVDNVNLNARFYVNGVDQGSVAMSQAMVLPTSRPVYIGTYSAQSQYAWEGSWASVRYYYNMLATAYIQQNYRAGIAWPVPGLWLDTFNLNGQVNYFLRPGADFGAPILTFDEVAGYTGAVLPLNATEANLIPMTIPLSVYGTDEGDLNAKIDAINTAIGAIGASGKYLTYVPLQVSASQTTQAQVYPVTYSPKVPYPREQEAVIGGTTPIVINLNRLPA